MNLSRCLSIGLLAAFLFAGTAGAGTEVMQIDPLADKDLYHFKQEGPGKWKIDDTSDDIHTLIVCPKAKEDTSLLFIKRKFKHGFRLTMDVFGGSKYKGLEFYLVPPEGDRIQVPFNKRWLSKKGWHRFMVTLEKGKVRVRIDDEKGDAVEVEEGIEYTFAMKLTKRTEAMFRKPMLKFLVVSEEQAKAEDGFVRIFDGTGTEGWITVPADKPEVKDVFKVADQRIDGKFARGPTFYAQFVYKDAVFTDYILTFRASGNTRGLHMFVEQGQFPGIDEYFARERDWNEVSWEVKDRQVTMKINGNVVLHAKQAQTVATPPQFLLHPGGKCTFRDIQVKGHNRQPGPSWAKYAAASGVSAGGGRQAGGGGSNQPQPGAGGGQGGRQLFNGTDLTGWGARPGDAWIVQGGEIVGLTLDKANAAELIYQQFVFVNYRLLFKVKRGTAGAKFIARAIPPADQKAGASKKPIAVDIKVEWLKDNEWNDFEVTVTGGDLKIKVNGKQVHSGTVYKESGFFGFVIVPNSAIGLKDIVLH